MASTKDMIEKRERRDSEVSSSHWDMLCCKQDRVSDSSNKTAEHDEAESVLETVRQKTDCEGDDG